MNNKNIAIVIIILLIAGAGVWTSLKLRKSEPAKEETNNQQAQNEAQEQKSKTMTETLNNCSRTFDQDKLTNTKVDTVNKFVTLQVRNFGTIKVQLYDKDAPKTVENFLRLVNSGYYDCLTFHRVAKGFVIQGGDPTGTGRGGDSAFGGPFADELNADTVSYKAGYTKGVLAMANAGPNTNTSQFFIMLADAGLPHNYTIFGKVTEGQDTVDKIGAVDITPQLGPTDGTPKEVVVIEKAIIN